MSLWLLQFERRAMNDSRFKTYSTMCCFESDDPTRMMPLYGERLCGDDAWLVLHKLTTQQQRIVGAAVRACSQSQSAADLGMPLLLE